MLPAPWRIRRARRDTRDTFTLDLEPVKTGDSLPFLPGQFNMLYIFGAGEVPISMSGDPANPGSMTHTVRAVGAVTKAMSKLKRATRSACAARSARTGRLKRRWARMS